MYHESVLIVSFNIFILNVLKMDQKIDDIPGTSSIDSSIRVGKKFKFSRMGGKSLDTSLSYSKIPLEKIPESRIYSGTIHHFESTNHNNSPKKLRTIFF